MWLCIAMHNKLIQTRNCALLVLHKSQYILCLANITTGTHTLAMFFLIFFMNVCCKNLKLGQQTLLCRDYSRNCSNRAEGEGFLSKSLVE